MCYKLDSIGRFYFKKGRLIGADGELVLSYMHDEGNNSKRQLKNIEGHLNLILHKAYTIPSQETLDNCSSH